MQAYLFSFVVPYLLASMVVGLLLRLAGMNISRLPGKLIVLGIPLMLILLPVKQVPVARFVTGLNADFSITLVALLLNHFSWKIEGIRLLDQRALRTISLSGLFLGLCLYSCSMNLVPLDLYRLGWGSVFLLGPLFLLTILLIMRGNRAGFVLAACVAAYGLKLLESENLWDYLLDPFLMGWCLIAAVVDCLSFVRSFFSPGDTIVKS